MLAYGVNIVGIFIGYLFNEVDVITTKIYFSQ